MRKFRSNKEDDSEDTELPARKDDAEQASAAVADAIEKIDAQEDAGEDDAAAQLAARKNIWSQIAEDLAVMSAGFASEYARKEMALEERRKMVRKAKAELAKLGLSTVSDGCLEYIVADAERLGEAKRIFAEYQAEEAAWAARWPEYVGCVC